MVEQLDLIDANDHVIGRAPKYECLEKGLLHRAILVFLVKEDTNEIYIQKRARDCMFYGGYWSASCTGHVSSGETYAQGAKREVKEELGIENCELRELGKLMTPKWNVGSNTEWEMITVFESRYTQSQIKLSEETEEGKFISVVEFKNLISNEAEMFTPDTLLAISYYDKVK